MGGDIGVVAGVALAGLVLGACAGVQAEPRPACSTGEVSRHGLAKKLPGQGR
ncbi:MAG: hypothetical protein ACR2HA_05270 [Nocardioides sp.]